MEGALSQANLNTSLYVYMWYYNVNRSLNFRILKSHYMDNLWIGHISNVFAKSPNGNHTDDASHEGQHHDIHPQVSSAITTLTLVYILIQSTHYSQAQSAPF